MLRFACCRTSLYRKENPLFSRRSVLKSLVFAPWAFRPAPLHGSWLAREEALSGTGAIPALNASDGSHFPFHDVRLTPHYPAKSPLDDVLRLVPPGSDSYITEKYAFEVESLLRAWARSIVASIEDTSVLTKLLNPAIEVTSMVATEDIRLRSGSGIDAIRRHFGTQSGRGTEYFLNQMKGWLSSLSSIKTAEFEITALEQLSDAPIRLRLTIQYDVVGTRTEHGLEERVGTWTTEWVSHEPSVWQAVRWKPDGETRSTTRGPMFADVTSQWLGKTDSYNKQLLRGSDYWRTVLDGACGIDVYGNNGLAAGDFDNDGFDDLYICQPAGLPNRLYRNKGDGTFEDVTEKAGVGVLDNTACALFADFQNRGLQDLLVVCGSGPLLFVNQGNGTFSIKRDAFKFAQAPQGTFTHAALADYDRDGRLDIYFCLYSYYLGLDQYHYPVPYFDARNGPPNYLLHNEGDGTFSDKTETAGLNVDNNRYSFASAWGMSEKGGFPDLYVANDFGRNNLYRNNGNGTFTAVSGSAHVEDVAAGMSASWSDVDNDGRQDIYVANMWSAAGQRVSAQKQFHERSAPELRAFYQRHAGGNTLYRNLGEGHFENASRKAGVEKGRWAWSSDFWDFDHDGYPDLYVTNGYVSAPVTTTEAVRNDLGSFFWRQVVAKSPDDATPTLNYERGWQALNELIRSDSSWSGHERNVAFANNQDGTFTEVSGAVELDFIEDSRAFVLADLDRDGRLELILKNRNGPQVRILHNELDGLHPSVTFRLRGRQSNRDGIGVAITLEAGQLHQTRYLQAGSGFLSQHSKELIFGVGDWKESVQATIHWPSGQTQRFNNIPLDHRIEVEEGSQTFAALPLASAMRRSISPSVAAEEIPQNVETWLIEPLKAPGFSLPDPTGEVHQLKDFSGSHVLIQFWSVTVASSRQQLVDFNRNRSVFLSGQVKVLALNLDEPKENGRAHDFIAEAKLSIFTLFATEDVAGIYNIVYRYMFDRRRDLAIPSSLLLDRDGMIVKLYQGAVEAARIVEDVQSIPITAAARLQKALPFPGDFYHGGSQRNDFTYGVAMFQHGYLEPAAEAFQQVIMAKPDDPEGYYNLGTLSLRRNDFVQARRYLQQTIKLRPNYPEAWNNLGMMSAQEGHAEEAVQNFQQALSLRPGYAIALLNLGNVYRRMGNFDKAHECLTQALSLQPDDAEANYSMGMLYAQQTQLAGAADYLQKAIDERPDYPEALNNLGIVAVRQQQYASAEAHFRKCISVAPSFDQAYLNLARLYALQHDLQRATDVVNDLLRLQPENQNAKKALEMFKAAQ
jgi:Flp pilus assembly protein TadD/peroxiredoxin